MQVFEPFDTKQFDIIDALKHYNIIEQDRSYLANYTKEESIALRNILLSKWNEIDFDMKVIFHALNFTLPYWSYLYPALCDQNQNLNKIKLVTYSLILILSLMLPNAYAQNNSAADIMKKSLENLQKSANKSTNTVQPSSNQKPQVNQEVSVPSVPSVPKSNADFINSNFAKLFANPDNYKNSTIDVTGKVATFPEVGLLQMYIGGAVPHDAIVHYNASFSFVEGDCVKVTGIVEQQFDGTIFSAKRIVPSISARSIDKIDCTQATLVSLPVALPSADTLTEKEFSVYGNLDCNNPNAIARFVWNYSEFSTQKEQCEYYVQAAKIMQTKIGIGLEANITIKNITIKTEP